MSIAADNFMKNFEVQLEVCDERATITITRYAGNSEEVSIPASVGSIPITAIGDYFVFHAKNIKSITLPEGIISIGDSAFSNCENLNSITLPESLTSIKDNAFDTCKLLTSIKLPKNLIDIGHNVFSECSNLEKIIVDEKNTAFKAKEGVLYDKAMTTLVLYPQGKNGEYTIPDTVVDIKCDSFQGCNGLNKITIPPNLFFIPQPAFYDCESLSGIVVDVKNTVFSSIDGILFDKDAFVLYRYPQGRVNSNYTVPPKTTHIAERAFYHCKKLNSINLPESLQFIEAYAFEGCEELTSIILPAGLKHIGHYAFKDCPNLKSITLSGNTKFGYKAFGGFSGKLMYRD